MMSKIAAAVMMMTFTGFVACTEGDEATPSGPTTATTSPSQQQPGPATPGATAAVPANCPGGDEGGAVPTSPSELQVWLGKRAYRCWTHESAVHASAGPHGGNVQVYLNAALDGSLKQNSQAGEHPQGSIAVKELFGSGREEVTGWAVGVKTQATSDSGRGWYWYEAFSTKPDTTGALEGQGKELCSNCHSGGKDFVLITYPLR